MNTINWLIGVNRMKGCTYREYPLVGKVSGVALGVEFEFLVLVSEERPTIIAAKKFKMINEYDKRTCG